MNEIFNSKRFIAYASKHYTEKGRSYLLIGALAFLLVTVVNLILFKSDETLPASLLMPMQVCRIMGFVVILTVVELSMGTFRRRSTSITEYMFPVSDYEKYSFAIINSLFCWIIYAGLCCLSFLLLHAIFDFPLNILETILRLWGIPGLLIQVLLVQAFSVFSNTVGGSNPLKGYLVVGCGIILFFSLFSFPKWLGIINDRGWLDFIPYLSISPGIDSGEDTILFYISRISYSCKPYVEAVFLLSAVIISWISGYFKFRERQLKN